jgi:hypothetical protein
LKSKSGVSIFLYDIIDKVDDRYDTKTAFRLIVLYKGIQANQSKEETIVATV